MLDGGVRAPPRRDPDNVRRLEGGMPRYRLSRGPGRGRGSARGGRQNLGGADGDHPGDGAENARRADREGDVGGAGEYAG